LDCTDTNHLIHIQCCRVLGCDVGVTVGSFNATLTIVSRGLYPRLYTSIRCTSMRGFVVNRTLNSPACHHLIRLLNFAPIRSPTASVTKETRWPVEM
jgi:hypothetical protein